ncbi:putative polyketide synthase [Xylariaceae sp. FL1651]|nr:putative polyketide synthase [Xylariaceae sp. FL1651]
MGDSRWLAEHQAPLFEPIAIIGMAMRLPGHVRSDEDFWNLLTQKTNALCDVPRDRFNINGFYDGSRRSGTIPTNKGYFLEDIDIREFDPSVFPIPKKELERLDPSQRQLLQVAYECMENAGVTSWRGSDLGCYIGCFGEDWQDLNAKETQHKGGYRATGYGDFALGNRISYEFDLRGPSMTVKTACSSSLVCLDLACAAIRDGKCDGALVGGSSLIFSPTMWLALHDQGLLSPTGQCRTFDESADGYARGEAVNMILIKRASDALRDNDPIRAIIRGTSVNTDGRTQGMLIPSPVSQAALIRKTYAVAGINDLSKTAIVETHGTGTPVGDPLEAQAVAECFGDQGVTITSVKPNVGHSEAAAGLTSLIKCVLALEHRLVPPNINFATPNPKIPFESYQLHVPTEVEPWPEGRAERVSVNSFGIGGVNAHVIIESPRQFGISNETLTNGVLHEEDTQELLLFSAYSATSLEAQIKSYQEYTKEKRVPLRDLAYSLANRRERRLHRAYAIAANSSSWQVSTFDAVKSPPRVAWVFTGQGAQWPQMGAELLDTNFIFRDTIRKLDSFLLTLPVPPPWTIEDELRKDSNDSRVHRAEMGHPLSLALQIGLVDVLRSWGIRPDVVLGHSSGEMAAAYASGAITAESAIAAGVFRGTFSDSSNRPGSMAAVGLGRDDILPYLVPGVMIACENSQCSITLSGDTEGVERVIKTLNTERPGVFSRFLRVEKAFHSHHMWEHGPSYENHIQPYMPKLTAEPKVPFYSSVTGNRLLGAGSLGPSYWRSNMESPVLFNSALRSVLQDNSHNMVLIEIGPHPALGGPIRQILSDVDRTDVHIGTLSRGRGCQESLLHLGGRLFQQGVSINHSVVCPPGHFIRDLPRYAWKRDTTYWAESRVSHEWRFREHSPHELLGSRVFESASEPCWRNLLHLEDVAWLSGHEVNGKIVFPAAAYIAMVGEALRQLCGETTFTVKNVHITSARVLEADKGIEFITNLKPVMLDASETSSWYTFTISSFDGTRWVSNCSGETRASTEKSFLIKSESLVQEKLPRKVNEGGWYNHLSRVGFNYTGIFKGLQCISAATNTNKASATVLAHEQRDIHGGLYSLHPSTIDKCFQIFTVAACRGLGRNMKTLAVPTFIEEMVISPSTTELNIRAEVPIIERGSFSGNLIAQDTKEQCICLKGFKASALTTGTETERDPIITQLEWRPSSDFVDLNKHLHPRRESSVAWPLLEELVTLCIFDHQERVELGDTTPPYLNNFVKWMQTHTERYILGANRFISENSHLEQLSGEDRLARIEEIVADMSTSPWSMFSTAIHRLFAAALTIFAGETHPLSILGEGNVLAQVYTAGDTLGFDAAIQLIANTNPQLRILEVGAGTGGTTVKVLQALKSSYGERLYAKYTYTDISSGFLAAAGERFANYENIEFAVLDITKNPVEQGFQLASYDLIVCSNVLHAVPSLQRSLRYVHDLLSPGGRIFLEELCPEAKFINYIFGFLPGWWLGTEDDRREQPYITPERWTEELVSAGFQEPEAIALDGNSPYHLSAGILASRQSFVARPGRVTLLSHTPEGPLVSEMRHCLESQQISVDTCLFGQPLPEHQDVISLIDLQEPIIHCLSGNTFRILMGYLQALRAHMLWVMQASQVKCEDPGAAMALGLARTARNELSIKFLTVEVDSVTPYPVVAEAAAKILLKAISPYHNAASIGPDYEYVVKQGEILIPRFHWQTVSEAAVRHRRQRDSEDITLKRMEIGTPGLLRSMMWSEDKVSHPAEGEVFIETKAVGLNFRDVLIALGILDNSTSEIGLEGSGIVQAIGPGVRHVSVGDRVMYMSSGCFTTHLTMPATLCVKMDDAMSFEQGAAVPCVYATALLALVDKANLQQGQIYCTAGSEAKIQYLMENYGIDRSRIFNSRESSFLPALMQVTNNRGVDVVLNSLSGDLLHASWKCVAEFGVMIEIGKRDFRRRAKLSMEDFEQNRTFVGLDLWQITQNRPNQAAK